VECIGSKAHDGRWRLITLALGHSAEPLTRQRPVRIARGAILPTVLLGVVGRYINTDFFFFLAGARLGLLGSVWRASHPGHPPHFLNAPSLTQKCSTKRGCRCHAYHHSSSSKCSDEEKRQGACHDGQPDGNVGSIEASRFERIEVLC